jgi:hypothetical protein
MHGPISVAVAAVIATAAATCPAAGADTSLPPCSRTAGAINPASQLDHPNCRLHSNDRMGLNFDVTYWSTGPSEPPRAAKVVVTDGSGTVIQTINEMLEPSSPDAVGLQDLDGDGRDEVIIPIARHSFSGSPNTRFAVWRADGNREHFERTQMVGQAIYPSGDGYVVTNGGALTNRDLTFYLPTGAGFTLVVVLTIEAEQVDPATGKVQTVLCRAHQEDGLHAIDMNIRQAQDTFCASPTANAIWPGAQRIEPPTRRETRG